MPSPIQTKRPKSTRPLAGDLQFEAAAEEDQPVGAPAPAGAGQEAAPQVAPEQQRVPAASASGCGRRSGSSGSRRRRTLDWRGRGRRRQNRASLAERLVAGDKRALARAITLIEYDDPAGWELVREVYPRTGKARIVGFTGPPGVGKSTLIGALTAELRKAEREVAVLSIDPSSPFTRGALLGDRIRLSDHFLDPGVFIRSMATRGALGGLSEAALQVALVMDAAGKDDVLIETVGVGQAEIDIVDHADTIVLALMPGSGDSIQALKAGVMEIPDVIVVNKADHPMTDTMVREVRGVLALSHDPSGWKVPIVRTEAARGEGVAELAEKIDAHRAYIEADGHARGAARPQPAQRGAGARRPRACAGGWRRRPPTTPRRAALLERVVRRELDPASAAASCWSGRPMADAPVRERRPPSRERRSAWVGCELDDLGGSPVGRVHGVYVDTESGEPGLADRALEQRGGLLGRRRQDRRVPLRDCAGAAGRVWAAHGREAVLERPDRRPDPAAAREHELAICAHYGIGEDRPRRRGRRPPRQPSPRSPAAASAGRRPRRRDHHLLDLVGALADREDLGVAVEAADRVLLDVAVAAVDGLFERGSAAEAACGTLFATLPELRLLPWLRSWIGRSGFPTRSWRSLEGWGLWESRFRTEYGGGGADTLLRARC